MITSLFMVNSFLDEQKAVAEGNKSNQQKAIDRYLKAKELPRKQKKHERKLAQRDYSFWVSLDNWHKQTMNWDFN